MLECKISKEVLEDMYIRDGKTIAAIANELNLATGTIFNYLKKYDIPTRRVHDYPTTDKQRQAWSEIGRNGKGKKLSDKIKRKIGEANTKGGLGHKKRRTDGYVSIYFPDHPQSNSDGYIMEHVLVMECLIGRPLKENECVHHRNEKRDDNRKDNLQLMTKREHMSYHMKLRHKRRKDDDLLTQ